MLSYELLDSLKKKMAKNIKEILLLGLDTKKKQDQSPVTAIDLYISNLIKEDILESKDFSDYSFFSEEDAQNFKYPCIILDPIDGTRELVRGVEECAVSLAIMPTPFLKDSFAWIYNPFSGFEISTNSTFVPHPHRQEFEPLLGLISRSEWEKGFYSNHDFSKSLLAPRGSIALKLGMLAANMADYVVTRRPKNVWDIAAGTIIAHRHNIFMYQEGKKIESFIEGENSYNYPIFWCREEIKDRIWKLFQS